MKKFEFNRHKVCTNPNTYLHIDDKHYEVQVKTAQQSNGGWIWGLFVSLCGTCGGIPCDISSHPFPTEEAAGHEGLKQAKSLIKEQLDNYKSVGNREESIIICHKAIRAIEKALQPKQLLLFS